MTGTPADIQLRGTIAERLRTRSGEIARSVTVEFLRRHPDWTEKYGSLARTRGEEDARFHVEFLAGAVLSGSTSGFEHYARWTARMLRARGIEPPFLVENLRQVARAAEEVVTEEDAGPIIGAMLDAAVRAIGNDRESSEGDAAADSGSVLRTERLLYLQAIRSGERQAALTIALEALREGATVPGVYRHVLQPAQYELGRLWERNEISVAVEHMGTAITQYVMARLYEHLDIPESSRGNAVVTGVRGELHQLGANMVADVLEADGWNVRFLGTQLPHRDVLAAVAEHAPGLVGVSATVLSNLPAVADLIEALRRNGDRDLSILVGGGAFRADPGTWREVGADGTGRDLDDAVTRAAALTTADR